MKHKIILAFLMSVVLSLVAWRVISFLITPLSFGQYLFIEIFLLSMHTFYKFVHRRLKAASFN